MPKCCGGATCACKIDAGDGISVAGSGTSQDPFVISADNAVEGQDNTVFDVTVIGSGQPSDPFKIEVDYALTAKLDDIPDVNAPAPTNAQVLGWDSSTQKWTPRAPTTAAAGSVQHDTTLSGDGSGGSPLAVVLTGGYLTSAGGAGIKLTDGALNQMNRIFADDAARAAASPALGAGAISSLGTDPGFLWYNDGSANYVLNGQHFLVPINGAFLEISGAYTNGDPTIRKMKQITITTDGSGVFDVFDPTDLGTASGVLMVTLQEAGVVPFKAMVYANTDRISAVAYSLVDGSVLASANLSAVAYGIFY